jgi:hypothetical protein
MKTNQTLNTNPASNAPDTLKLLREFYLQYAKRTRQEEVDLKADQYTVFQQKVNLALFQSHNS